MDAKVTKKKAETKEVKDTVISKLYSYETPVSYYDTHTASMETMYKEKYDMMAMPSIVDPHCRVGIEVEVENAYHFNDNYMYCWKVHEDSSLRNNGREFVTYPIQGQQIPLALKVLYDHILREGYDFSKRTSVHVHVNVRGMTPSQVTAYVCLFMVFERLLYKFVGHDRDKNIFCVPLYQTLIMNSLLTAMQRGFKGHRWYKYSGLNLLPIGSTNQGTVEFRQLYGTDDVQLICNWINLLQRLRLYAMSADLDTILSEIRNLNTNSQYDFFLTKVFQEQARLLDTDSLPADMEPGVICVKECTLVNRFHQGMLTSVKSDSELGSILVAGLPKQPAARTIEDVVLGYAEAPQEVRINSFDRGNSFIHIGAAGLMTGTRAQEPQPAPRAMTTQEATEIIRRQLDSHRLLMEGEERATPEPIPMDIEADLDFLDDEPELRDQA